MKSTKNMGENWSKDAPAKILGPDTVYAIYLHISFFPPEPFQFIPPIPAPRVASSSSINVSTYSQNFLFSDVITRQVPPLKQKSCLSHSSVNGLSTGRSAHAHARRPTISRQVAQLRQKLQATARNCRENNSAESQPTGGST